MTFPPMRPRVEIQHTHDLLQEVLADRRITEVVIPDQYVRPLRMALDCLCWCLHHDADSDHGSGDFAYLIRQLKKDLDELGWPGEERPGEYIVED